MRKSTIQERCAVSCILLMVLAGCQAAWGSGLRPPRQDSRRQDHALPLGSNQPSSAVQPLFVTDLLFATQGHPVSEPLVQATIAGRRVMLAVDTGARMTVLDPSLAAPAAGEAGSKHANWANNLEIEIGGAKLTLQTVALEPMGETLIQDQGIYGFLSPQELAHSVAVMIDFPGRRLFGFRSPDDMQAWLKRMNLMKQTMAVDVRNQEGRLAVSTTVGKGPPVWLELDTAAPDTMLPVGYSVGKRSKKDEQIQGHEMAFKRVRISLGGGLEASGTVYEPVGNPLGGGSGRLSPHLGVNFLRHFMIGIPGVSPKVIWMSGGRK